MSGLCHLAAASGDAETVQTIFGEERTRPVKNQLTMLDGEVLRFGGSLLRFVRVTLRWLWL